MDYQVRPNLQTIDDIDREYEKTVKEIKRLQDKLQDLRTYRNQLVPISRLPIETLAEILSLTQELPFDSKNRSRGQVLTSTVSICRHWRHLVLSTPFFWNHIGINNLSWLECSLERSRDLPLVINLALGRRDPLDKEELETVSKMLSMLRPLLPRIRSFDFWNSPYSDVRFDLPGSPAWGAAERLETLALEGVDIPDSFLGRELPVLQNLSLDGCYFDWKKAFPFLGLNRLRIIQSGPRITSQALLHILRGIPSLEHLELENALRDDERRLQHHHQDDRVQLPFLRYMHLADADDYQIHNFFGGITIPSTARIYTGVDPKGNDDQTSIHTFSAVQNCLADHWSPIVLDISIACMTSLKIYETVPEVGRTIPTLHSEFTDICHNVIIEAAFIDFNFTNLTILDISSRRSGLSANTPTQVPRFHDTFGQLPHLRVLKTRKDATPPMVQHLFENVNSMHQPQAQSCPLSFQALEVLALERWKSESESSDYTYHQEHLISALELRASCNHPLQRLIFYIQDHQGVGLERDDASLQKFSESGLADSVEQLLHSEF
ncbi:hypothetical protein BDN72DRAFT_881907 [Pluteus cervinus]|uniref:Uncharacterized protein n=1 Tax=Pluteus cervinus TaxID=181527 RepID=A0ACD3ADU0_9AGAR|nr:hypothetical protein BDN72DRAFT_881907 [Pluteus cervinus]